MRARPIGILAATLAGALLAACGATASTSAPPTTAPPVTAGLSATMGPVAHRGGAPIDVGRVRLWLPRGWALASDDCAPGAKSFACLGLASTCPPGSGDTVHVATFSVPLYCRGAASGNGSVWLFPRRLGHGPPTWRRLAFGRDGVVVEVPALGVALYGFSPIGVRIAESFGPSPLEGLLAARLPVAPPHGWHRVAYGTLSVAVPKSWPEHLLTGSRYADPGACEFSDFTTPVADTGAGSLIYFCPLIDSDTVLRANAAPVNGVWLQAEAPSRTGGSFDLGGSTRVLRRVHGLRLELDVPRSLHGSDALQVVVHHDGRVAGLLLGLGRSPLIAEQVLSSIELVR